MSAQAPDPKSSGFSPDDLRDEVARTYGERVGQRAASGCGCGGTEARSSAIAGIVGYSAAELAALPADAAADSFGCGNPTALAGLQEGDVVLDLGSGVGIDLMLAAKLVGPSGRAIGIDMTDEMIAKARKNITAGGFTNIEVRKGIIEELPVEDASIDWVISNCVINLSPEKARVFAEIARVLRPGGQMLVSDLVAEDLPAEVRALPALRDACVAGAISEEGYVAGLRAAGLADVEVRGRLKFSAAQIAEFAESTFEGLIGSDEAQALLRRYALDLEGKVWSAKVYARKPGGHD